jgi:hypothetical protein
LALLLLHSDRRRGLNFILLIAVYLVIVDPQLTTHISPKSLDFLRVALFGFLFHCQCSGLGDSWKVEELAHQIIQLLNGRRSALLVGQLNVGFGLLLCVFVFLDRFHFLCRGLLVTLIVRDKLNLGPRVIFNRIVKAAAQRSVVEIGFVLEQGQRVALDLVAGL